MKIATNEFILPAEVKEMTEIQTNESNEIKVFVNGTPKWENIPKDKQDEILSALIGKLNDFMGDIY